MKVGEKTYWAAEVLAGAYHGKALEARALLVHTVLVDERENVVKALCGYRKLDNLITDSGDVEREPTCAKCKERLEALRTKAFKEWAHDGAVAMTKGLAASPLPGPRCAACGTTDPNAEWPARTSKTCLPCTIAAREA